MTKKELHETVLAKLEAAGIKPKSDLYKELDELLKPKAAGVKMNLEDFATLDENGKAVKITCRLSGVELPATKEFFYSDKNSKVECSNGDVVYPHSLQAIAIKREFEKTNKASEAAITKDVMDEVITPAQGKELIAALPTAPDYSTVTDQLPEPEADTAETEAV